MIETLMLFGVTGDLAGRFLLPALATLYAKGELPARFAIIGAARDELDDEAFRRHAAEQLTQHAANVPAAAHEALLRSLRYYKADVADRESVRRVIGASAPDGQSAGAPVAVYLALPPSLFTAAVTSVAAIGPPAGSRLVLEKPFGEDLASAVALNALLRRLLGDAIDQVVFRVDHVLGMASVQNLLTMRLANHVLAALWNNAHIAEVEILWEETLALEGRANYYDRAGALKDVMQNHMLQILSLIAMEPPASPSAQELHDRRVELLRAVHAPQADDTTWRTRRARYTAGRIVQAGAEHGITVPSYADEAGVDPERGTETFAEVVLEIDNRRWKGTRFVLRAGKALGQRWKGVIVRFRPTSYSPFSGDGREPRANELRIGLDGPDELSLHLTGGLHNSHGELVPLSLTAPMPATDLPAYGRVLLDILDGGSALSVRGDEAEEAWRIVTPVLQAWSEGRVALEEYIAGSAGPPPLPRRRPSASHRVSRRRQSEAASRP